MRKIPFILLLATVIVGCNRGQDGADAVVDNPVEVMGDTLTVPANSVIASRLVCGTVVDTAFTTTLTTTGRMPRWLRLLPAEWYARWCAWGRP